MGETAENVADKWKISREAQDTFGLTSQRKYFAAAKANRFKEELVSVSVTKGKETFEFMQGRISARNFT
jgi:acetyl-CoA acetyltransferase